jgi:hypothetical protein
MVDETESTFDSDSFMNASVEGEMETRFEPVPEGEYTAVIENVAVKEVDGPEGKIKICDVTWDIMDEDLKTNLGREKLQVRQGVFLDVDNKGNIVIGANKNIQLGRIRAALGQNTSSSWNFAKLLGSAPATIKVGVKPDKDDPETLYNRVLKVSKI